jgi:hypothetical protein
MEIAGKRVLGGKAARTAHMRIGRVLFNHRQKKNPFRRHHVSQWQIRINSKKTI